MLNRVHAYLGLALVLPLFVWAVTGFVFLLKPGFSQAYEQLSFQTPYDSRVRVRPQQHWLQLRFVQSPLGPHLLVETESGELLHLHPRSLAPRAYPTDEQLAVLFAAATEHNRPRYGDIAVIEREGPLARIVTSTEVQLDLDWRTMTLEQSGSDTRWIDRLYRLHYLQWSPSPVLNGAILLLALAGLLLMCFVGLRMLISFHHKEPS